MPSKRTGKTILAIKKNRKGLYVVSFTAEKLVLSEDAFTEIPLYVGKELAPEEEKLLRSFLQSEKNYQYALSLAAKGAYSAHDIRVKLEKKSADKSANYSILDRLKKSGLLDDRAFAEEYLEEKARAGYGSLRIHDDLRFKHGVNEQILSQLVYPSEKGKVQELLQRNERKWASLPLQGKRDKARNFLTLRGYSEAVIESALATLKEEKKNAREALQKKAREAKKHYERKYKAYDLRAHIYAYLMAHGYASSDIEEVLEDIL